MPPMMATPHSPIFFDAMLYARHAPYLVYATLRHGIAYHYSIMRAMPR